ncbi:MAG TPA: STAS domain-containing protein [Burkholderiales bacterium]
MVFSFFKKKGALPPAAPRSAITEQPAARSPAAEFHVDPHSTVSSIEVSDGGEAGLSQVTEEAAILYANGRVDTAIDLLRRGIAEPDGARRNRPAWFMLFDLFQIQGMRAEFDRLALDFVVEFERSAPTWQGGPAQAPTPPLRPPKREPRYALQGRLGADSRRLVADMEEMAGRDGTLRLELGGLQAVDDAGCTLLIEAMQRMESLGRMVKLRKADTLQRLLRAEIERRGRSCARTVWLLLLRLYQLRGMHEEFESLSLEFAMAYEVSPPPWEASRALPPEPPSGEFELPPASDVPPDALVLTGVLSGASPAQLGELNDYAAARTVLNVDLSGVSRVDFVAAGALLNVLTGFKRSGKAVTIHGASEMIQALLAIVGANHYATVARNKQH